MDSFFVENDWCGFYSRQNPTNSSLLISASYGVWWNIWKKNYSAKQVVFCAYPKFCLPTWKQESSKFVCCTQRNYLGSRGLRMIITNLSEWRRGRFDWQQVRSGKWEGSGSLINWVPCALFQGAAAIQAQSLSMGCNILLFLGIEILH